MPETGVLGHSVEHFCWHLSGQSQSHAHAGVQHLLSAMVTTGQKWNDPLNLFKERYHCRPHSPPEGPACQGGGSSNHVQSKQKASGRRIPLSHPEQGSQCTELIGRVPSRHGGGRGEAGKEGRILHWTPEMVTANLGDIVHKPQPQPTSGTLCATCLSAAPPPKMHGAGRFPTPTRAGVASLVLWSLRSQEEFV